MKTKLTAQKRRVILENEGMKKVMELDIPFYDEAPEIIICDDVVYKATTSYRPTTYRECLLVHCVKGLEVFDEIVPAADDDDTDTIPPDPNAKPVGQEI